MTMSDEESQVSRQTREIWPNAKSTSFADTCQTTNEREAFSDDTMPKDQCSLSKLQLINLNLTTSFIRAQMFDFLRDTTGYVQVAGTTQRKNSTYNQDEHSNKIRRHWRLIAEIAILALVSGCFLALLWSRESMHSIRDRTTEPATSSQVRYETIRFNGTFGLESTFTGVGPEVDTAWDEITGGECRCLVSQRRDL